jgi:hypothetical protein
MWQQPWRDMLAAWGTLGALDTTRDFGGRQVPAVFMLPHPSQPCPGAPPRPPARLRLPGSQESPAEPV